VKLGPGQQSGSVESSRAGQQRPAERLGLVEVSELEQRPDLGLRFDDRHRLEQVRRRPQVDGLATERAAPASGLLHVGAVQGGQLAFGGSLEHGRRHDAVGSEALEAPSGHGSLDLTARFVSARLHPLLVEVGDGLPNCLRAGRPHQVGPYTIGLREHGEANLFALVRRPCCGEPVVGGFACGMNLVGPGELERARGDDDAECGDPGPSR